MVKKIVLFVLLITTFSLLQLKDLDTFGQSKQLTSSVSLSPNAQTPKSVDQTRKNIQVLKGLPESQLFLLMNFVASSLGEQCNFCHVQQGKDPNTGQTKWVWESDDKPEKAKARRMMQMVLSINATNNVDFTNNQVTCHTCHRGERHPVGLPSMPLSRSGHEPEPNTAAAASVILPSVEQILAKYNEAVGGPATASTKNLMLTGKREASQGRKFSTDITMVFPDKYLAVVTTPGGVVRQILNGDNAWVINGTKVQTLSTAEVNPLKRSLGELFNVVKVRPTESMRVTARQKVGDREAYVVEQTSEGKTERYYFDSQSGLLVRKITLNKTMLMAFPEQLDFEDYRDVDGVKVPFTIRYSAIDTYDSWTRTFTVIKRNVAVDDSLFAVPSGSPNP